MRTPRDPKGAIVGVVTALIACGLLASWSWHRHHGVAMLRPSATIVPAGVFPSDRPAVGAAIQQLDLGDAGGVLVGDPGRGALDRRVAQPQPPVADRPAYDPVPVGLPDLAVPLPPPRPVLLTMPIPAEPVVDEFTPGYCPPQRLRRTTEQPPGMAASWPLPGTVLASLAELRARQVATDWADRVAACLEDLHQLDSLADPRSAGLLDQLAGLVVTAYQLAAIQPVPDDRALVQRTVFALERRLPIWHGVYQLSQPQLTPVSLRSGGGEAAAMTQRMEAVERQLARLENPDSWRQYLLLDHISAMQARQWSACAAERSRLARAILTRLNAAIETPEEEQYFAAPAWQALSDELRKWVIEPVDYEQLLDDLEWLEDTGSEDAAFAIAQYYQLMRWSTSPLLAELGERVNRHYRNANVRVAVSAELVNRLLPSPQTMDEHVDDVLLGGRVFGRSRVSTRLNLVLFPDRQRWRMGLEVEGSVDSRTETKRGPAVFHNTGRARYLARKLLMMDHRGLHTEEAEAAAISNANLTRLETDVDAIPVVNLLVRAIARQQYDSKASEAKWEAEGLVANRVQSRVDQEVDKQVAEATERVHRQVLEPLESLGLRPETVDLETTPERLIARYRLARYDQVAAFTPRPQAPADSLISVQIHQSALNNVVSSLQLNARETDLPSLFRAVAERFRRSNYQVPEEVPTDVMLRLAEHDPIMLCCADDRLHVTLRIARLEGGDHNVFRDFEVRASYRVDVQGSRVQLERDGYVRVKGQRRRLSVGDDVVLRGVFSKVLAQYPQFDLLGNILTRNDRLQDLRVTQFVMRDGWIGVSLGTGAPPPERLAGAPAQGTRE